ncbi:aspartate ammonia-lyase [Candidatus Xianfuyuplasma coldseepsis]|uniref:Aspartate ammonia-lyase n=1 Tax=Candidatus Xianfuyuplasma coldseepsis TaxID=2782163 RepID=A0A7L7KT35_9MOLU|nr:aspartate ammonia-lyase [Xianfuyuplasma coldseepsis]QMS85396.1 aspartate ammonia-lyase [Xianfuyuplasma coldseepsis]
MRKETDQMGTIELPDNCLYGIATARAIMNFNISEQVVNNRIIHEMVNIKKQAALCNHELGYLSDEITTAITLACDQILAGDYRDSFVVCAHQGGAGTSTNMNVNEVIANKALQVLGHPCGSYHIIHPINHINLHQSTNDTFPTAVRIAAIKQLRLVANEYSFLQQTLQQKETEYGSILKLGRTQMMDAVPMLAGQMFGAQASVISRDRWRLYKVEERLRTMNIGGTAIGTGMNAPLKYTFMMTSKLQQSTNIGLSRADDLIDNTQNVDSFVEVSSLLKVAATTLIKMANDYRFLASGPHGGIGEISLKPHQAGSSIMPGKVNPVILEMTIQVAEKIIANDALITSLATRGNLELNAFLPGIAEALLESLELLTNTVHKFNNMCVKNIVVNKDICQQNLERSMSLITPLIHIIGYDKASWVVKQAQEHQMTIRDILVQEKLFTNKELDQLLDPLNITKPGIIKGVK